MKSDTLDRGMTIVVLAAIMLMAATVVHREIRLSSDEGPPPSPPTFVPNWRTYLPAGTVEAGEGNQVTLVEFGDLQCPACRDYQRVIRAVVKRFDKNIRVVFVHFPLPYHKMARPAALASQCANLQHRFGPFVNAVYEKQESLKVRPLSEYASDAKVPDIEAFSACLADSAKQASIVDLGIQTADAANINATPTILINGWQFGGATPEKYLRDFIRHQIDGLQHNGR